MTVHLEPGRFYAGISLPFFVTHAMVQHKLEGMGFSNISFHDRAQEAELAVDPKKYPGYDDSWSEWVQADWTGPKKDLDFDKHWSWLLVVPTANKPDPSGAGPSTPTPSASNPEAGFLETKPFISPGMVVLGLFVVGLGLLLRKTS